jgi:hypothetical protein
MVQRLPNCYKRRFWQCCSRWTWLIKVRRCTAAASRAAAPAILPFSWCTLWPHSTSTVSKRNSTWSEGPPLAIFTNSSSSSTGRLPQPSPLLHFPPLYCPPNTAQLHYCPTFPPCWQSLPTTNHTTTMSLQSKTLPHASSHLRISFHTHNSHPSIHRIQPAKEIHSRHL